MADWDETSPDDSDLVSQYPANARAARDAVRTNFGIDHHEANDGDIGKHEVIQLTSESEPTIDAGDIGIWNESGVLKTRVGTGDATQMDVFAAGTKMVFYQASAPTGWTQDTGVNDRVLKVVSGTGGGTGGSWTISGITTNNHAITISQMPSHNHGGSTGNAGNHSHSLNINSNGNHSHSGSANSNGAHTHDFDFGSGTGTFGEPARASGGSTAEGTTLSAGAHTHSLSINSNGSHTHSGSTSTQSSHDHSISSQGSGSGHNHGVSADGNWRPSHIDVLVAEKD